MFSVLVANPKGGSGKSTLSTNLAGYYACQGKKVMLGDVDKQQSSLAWLARRPEGLAPISGWEIAAGEPARPPKGTQVAILDSPAGLHGKKLDALIRRVDRILVPIQPSPFDMWASESFLGQLLEEKAVRKARVFLGVVAMRVDPRTRSARELEVFLSRYDIPVIGWLRDAQSYVRAAGEGLSIYDMPEGRTRKERESLASVVSWLGGAEPDHWFDK
ncbi:ParA family protein [Paludibacterium paludis]|uniref:Cobyrinic acid a,c-diamide synthase n=1 Tax=Paludibacterium paludis TaxID=1225769 RepID=A0A918UAX2_9NEIS|nr:ParA family protein [Paludibacterium paludis]GGY19221.1 cobyrinic acid a,c-diamide synthase [Paludibacterium paludis]